MYDPLDSLLAKFANHPLDNVVASDPDPEPSPVSDELFSVFKY